MIFEVKRGETLTIYLDDMDGIAGEVAAVTAQLRPGIASKRAVDPARPAAATFSVEDRAAAGGDPAGWTLTLGAATTAGVAAGYYLADARLAIDGGANEIVTDPLAIRIVEPATVRT